MSPGASVELSPYIDEIWQSLEIFDNKKDKKDKERGGKEPKINKLIDTLIARDRN